MSELVNKLRSLYVLFRILHCLKHVEILFIQITMMVRNDSSG